MSEETIILCMAFSVLIGMSIWSTVSVIKAKKAHVLVDSDVVSCAFTWCCLLIVIGFEVVRWAS